MPTQTVFVLQHEYELEGHDEVKLLGIFDDRALAEEAQMYFEKQEGFRDHADGFNIDEVELNRRLWSEGFVTVQYPID
jgi:hypothetical protein